MTLPLTTTTPLLLAILLTSTLHARITDTEITIDRLLAQALAATDLPTAQQQLDQARVVLQKAPGALDSLTRQFLQTHLGGIAARVLAADVRRNPDNTQRRRDARRQLRNALTAYQNFRKKAQDAADELPSPFARGRRSDKPIADARRRAQGYLTRTEYALAWTRYSLALLLADHEPDRAILLRAALREFAQFTAPGYRNHPIIAECFIGHALCLLQLDRAVEALQCLDRRTITPNNTTRDVFKRVTLVRLQAARLIPSHLNAIWAAQQYFRQIPPNQRLDQRDLELALLWAHSLHDLAADPQTRDLKRALTRQFDTVAARLYPYGQLWCDRLAEILLDGPLDSPFTALLAARDAFTRRDYSHAASLARKGRQVLEPNAPLQLAADLDYLAALAAWNNARWPDAFHPARRFLQTLPDDPRTPQVLTIALQAGLKTLSPAPASDHTSSVATASVDPNLPPTPTEYLALLDFAQQHFADQPPLRDAPWLRARALLCDRQIQQARKILQNIAPDNPLYPRALYGLALADYLQATAYPDNVNRDTKTPQPDQSPLFNSLARHLDIYTTLPPSRRAEPAGLDTAVADLALAAAHRMLTIAEPLSDLALTIVAQIEQMIPDDLSRLFFVRLRAYAAARDADRLIRLFDRVLDDQPDPAELHRALTELTAAWPDDPADAVPPTAATSFAPADEPFVRLLRYCLVRLRQLQIADPPSETLLRRRLAHTLYDHAHFDEALPHYQWLADNLPAPKTAHVLRQLALCCEHLQRPQAALIPWQRLARHLPPHTAPWYEAQYHAILVRHRAGQTHQAKKQLAYFQLRYQAIKDPQWQQRFAGLQNTLRPAAPLSNLQAPSGDPQASMASTDRAANTAAGPENRQHKQNP